MKKTIFKSIIVLIYSINNIHVGARLNRDQILYKILLEMLLKMRREEKNTDLFSLLCARPGLENGPRPARRTVPPASQTTAWAWAANLARALTPPGPKPVCLRASRSWPLDLI